MELKRKIKSNFFWNKTVKKRFILFTVAFLFLNPLILFVSVFISNWLNFGFLNFSFFKSENLLILKNNFQLILLAISPVFSPITGYLVSLISYIFKKGVIEESIRKVDGNISGKNASFIIDDENLKQGLSGEWLKISGSHRAADMKKLNEAYPTNSDMAGFVVRAVYNSSKKDMDISIAKESHLILYGVPGSAKSQTWILPNLLYTLRQKDIGNSNDFKKPCMIIHDPKGEIFNHSSVILENGGYRIKTLNFRNFEKSSNWNPLGTIYRVFQKGLNFWKEGIGWQKLSAKAELGFKTRAKSIKCNIHSKKICSTCTEEAIQNFLGEEKLYVMFPDTEDARYFTNMSDFESTILNKCTEYKEKAYNLVTELAYVICPDQDKDTHWTENPRAILEGIIYIFLELCEAEKDLKDKDKQITLDKFNLGNIVLILSKQEHFKMWFNEYKEKYQDEERKSINRLSAPMGLESNISTFINTISQKLSVWNSELLCNITSFDDVNLTDFFTEPTALYLILPDETEKFAFMASLFVKMAYMECVEIALDNGDKLPRNLHFILDEFGVMPKIPGFETMLAVSRSRKMFFMIITQTKQLIKQKYGNVTDSIIDNCQVHVALEIASKETIDEFVYKAGKYTQSEANLDSKGNVTGYSYKEVDLIPTERMTSLNKPLSVILNTKGFIRPIVSYNLPYFLGANNPVFVKSNGQQIYDGSLLKEEVHLGRLKRFRISVDANTKTEKKIEVNWKNTSALNLLSALYPPVVEISLIEFKTSIDFDDSYPDSMDIFDLLDDDIDIEIVEEGELEVNFSAKTLEYGDYDIDENDIDINETNENPEKIVRKLPNDLMEMVDKFGQLILIKEKSMSDIEKSFELSKEISEKIKNLEE